MRNIGIVFAIIFICELTWYALDEGFVHMQITAAKALISAAVLTALGMELNAIKLAHDRGRR